MDSSEFEKLFKGKIQTKYNTEQCLTEYYKSKGFNNFKAAEYAQNNVLNFVEFANNEIINSKQNHTSFFLSQVTKDIVLINQNHYQIKQIHQNLLKIGWRDFEILSSLILENCFGAYDVYTSPSTGDGGVDFEGKIPIQSTLSKENYGVLEVYGQSKKYNDNVGIYDIKAFVAFANSKKRNYVHPPQLFMFFTTAGFANNAIKELTANGFIGLSGHQLATLIFNHENILNGKSEIINYIIG